MLLAWQYSLTADELLQSQTQYFLFWKKLNLSTSIYDYIGALNFVKIVGALSYQEPRSPHIVIDRSDQATLHIKDVRREDEGTYKIEFILESDGTIVAEQRVNLTILGELSIVYHLFCVSHNCLPRNTSHFFSEDSSIGENSEILWWLFCAVWVTKKV